MKSEQNFDDASLKTIEIMSPESSRGWFPCIDNTLNGSRDAKRKWEKELTDSMKKGMDNNEASCCDHQTLSKGANDAHEIHSQLNGMTRIESHKKRRRRKKRRMESDALGKSSEEKNIVESLTDNSSVPIVEQETCAMEGNTVCDPNASTDVVSADKNNDEASQFDHSILPSDGSNLSKGANGAHEIHSELNGVKRRETKKQRWRKKRRMESGDSEDKVISEEGLQRTSTVESLIDTSLAQVTENDTSTLPRALRSSARKKLLVLDLNGLLCDVVHGHPKTHKPHERVGKSAVFKRPFCDSFMRFCCEKFDIGVWSSRKKENVIGVVNLIMSDVRDGLLFCWDASQCTYTGYKTIENSKKPLVLKQLKKLWNKEGDNLPWDEGDYSPSNTLLIDDSPYKALCNPPYTGVFPYPYSFIDENDNSLGPGGDLRVYLEGLALADDVQSYVRKHPFGRRPITSANPSWKFYEQVVNKIRDDSEVINADRCSTAAVESRSKHLTDSSHLSPLTKSKEESAGRLQPTKSHHPLAHLLNQTYASQSPVHSHTNHAPSNSSQSLPSKYFSPDKFLRSDVNFQPSQQVPPGPPGPPPLHHFPSDNQNAPIPSQHPIYFQSQPLPPNIFLSHRPPMVSDYHSQSTPLNPGWYGIPPPPPTFYSMPPRHDFHSQAFQSAKPSQLPSFHMDELGRRPLPLGNHHDHPFARDDRFSHPPMPDGPQIMLDSQRGYHLQNPSFSRVETHITFPGQGFASSSSFVHGSTIHPQPLPRESLPNILHYFPGEHVGARPISREEVSSSAIKEMPYSHNPPPYGQQQNISSSYHLNLPGSVDPNMQRYPSSFLDNRPPQYNPFASTFEQVPAGTKDVSRFSSSHVPVGGPGGQVLPSTGRTGLYLQENVDVVSGAQKLGVRNPVPGDSCEPLPDSIEPSSNMPNKFGHIREPSLAANDAGTISKLSNVHNPVDVEENSKRKEIASTEHKPEVDNFGEGATDAEVGAVENASLQPVDEKDWSPGLPIDMENAAASEIEVDQVRSPEKSKKCKDSRSMKLFKSALADFVKEVLKPSWRQGNMSKEAFKTIVKKTVEKVSGGMPSHHVPKSQAKINQYVESSQRNLTKLVMGYVDKIRQDVDNSQFLP